jgi:hypothetical protein
MSGWPAGGEELGRPGLTRNLPSQRAALIEGEVRSRVCGRAHVGAGSQARRRARDRARVRACGRAREHAVRSDDRGRPRTVSHAIAAHSSLRARVRARGCAGGWAPERARYRIRRGCMGLVWHCAVLADASTSLSPAMAADDLPRRCPPAGRAATGRRGLPVPPRRTPAPPRDPTPLSLLAACLPAEPARGVRLGILVRTPACRLGHER